MLYICASIAIVFFITTTIQGAYILHLRKRIKEPPTPIPSEELSDFLRDTQIHGYGFVRVNPDNVFLRK